LRRSSESFKSSKPSASLWVTSDGIWTCWKWFILPSCFLNRWGPHAFLLGTWMAPGTATPQRYSKGNHRSHFWIASDLFAELCIQTLASPALHPFTSKGRKRSPTLYRSSQPQAYRHNNSKDNHIATPHFIVCHCSYHSYPCQILSYPPELLNKSRYILYNGFYWFLFFLLHAPCYPSAVLADRDLRALRASPWPSRWMPLHRQWRPRLQRGVFHPLSQGPSDGLGWEMNHQNHQKPTYILTLHYIT
jgi:hypothetical protein